jgi:hypothetical protein
MKEYGPSQCCILVCVGEKVRTDFAPTGLLNGR